MGKKEKTAIALAEELQAMIALVPKLADFIKRHNEIAAGYQKYRKNGGAAIPGIEKHLGIQKEKNAPAVKKTVAATKSEIKAPKEAAVVKKDKKKAKK